METVKEWSEKIIGSVSSVFLGKNEVIEKILVALLCRGHVLLEDVPGVGKTVLAKAMAASIGGEFARIQCTPDLLPADILGVSIYNPQKGEFIFRQGPILSNFILVDEINRATPRTQSALLEAMAENQVSFEGKSQPLPAPFFLMATENPVEFEGTFPLPEAQKDRFLLSLNIGYPGVEQEKAILRAQRQPSHPVEGLSCITEINHLQELQAKVPEIHVDPKVEEYILTIIGKTRENIHLSLGASPRGSLALYKCGQALAAIRGRDYVIPEDVKEIALPVLNKRVILKPEYTFKGYNAGDVLTEILNTIPFPGLDGD